MIADVCVTPIAPATRSSSELASQFHAFSDETRVRIVGLLRGGEHCVCEMTQALELSQSLLSLHLKVLKDAGLLRDRREGRWEYYALSVEAIEAVGGFVRDLAKAPRRGQEPSLLRLSPRMTFSLSKRSGGRDRHGT